MPRYKHLPAAVVSAALSLAGARPVAGDGGASVRPRVGGVGIGAYAAAGGPAGAGLSAVAALYPGGRRSGVRVEARTAGDDDRFDRGFFTAGLVQEAAAARPRLSLALHGELGLLAPDVHPALGGGVELQLWVLGPLAVAVDASTHLLVDGLDSELVLSGALGLRLAR